MKDARIFGTDPKFAEILANQKFYNVKVKVYIQDDNGKIKTTNDTYLIATDSITEVDVIINSYFKDMTFDYKIISIREQSFTGIMLNSILTKRNLNDLI